MALQDIRNPTRKPAHIFGVYISRDWRQIEGKKLGILEPSMAIDQRK